MQLSVGPDTDVTIESQENRSTGFSWYITQNTCGHAFEMSKDVYTPHPVAEGDKKWARVHGAAGKRTWIFSTLGENDDYLRGQTCQVKFVYMRPWLKEEEQENLDKKVLNV